jgi:hypothetical protein
VESAAVKNVTHDEKSLLAAVYGLKQFVAVPDIDFTQKNTNWRTTRGEDAFIKRRSGGVNRLNRQGFFSQNHALLSYVQSDLGRGSALIHRRHSNSEPYALGPDGNPWPFKVDDRLRIQCSGIGGIPGLHPLAH